MKTILIITTGILAALVFGYFGAFQFSFLTLSQHQIFMIIAFVIVFFYGLACMAIYRTAAGKSANIRHKDLVRKYSALHSALKKTEAENRGLQNKIHEMDAYIDAMASKFDNQKHSKIVELTAEIERLKRKISSQNANYVRLLNKYNRVKDLNTTPTVLDIKKWWTNGVNTSEAFWKSAPCKAKYLI